MSVKFCSSISYLSEDELVSRLDDMVSRGLCKYYFYVPHFREVDEKRVHIHFALYECQKTLEYFNKECLEFLDAISFKKGNFADWFLYVTHNVLYLQLFEQKRRYRYKKVYSNMPFISDIYKYDS